MNRRTILTVSVVVLFAAGVVLVASLLWQYFRAYFTIEGAAPQPTAGQISDYEVTAAASIVVSIASLVVAIMLARSVRRASAIVLVAFAGFGVVITLAAALVFSIPQNRWLHPQPVPGSPVDTNLPASQTPCYSGSGTCN